MNITYFTDKQTERALQQGIVHSVEAIIDFSEKNAAIADTVRLLKIPQGAIVTGVDVIVLTAGTTSATMAIGDGTTADLFDGAIALDAAADTHTGTSSSESTLIAMNGKYYKAAGYIVGTIAGAAPIIGKYLVSATYRLLNKI